MDISIFFAKFLGLYLVLVIPAIIFNRRHLDRIIDEFSNNLGLVYLSGFFSLASGLVVVLLHNVWVFDWRVFVTILGWMGVAKGLIRFYFPEKLPVLARKFSEKTLRVWCLVFFVIGFYLVFVGFGY